MSLRWKLVLAVILLSCLFTLPLEFISEALAGECTGGFVRSSIGGEGNRVRLGLARRQSSCSSSSTQKINYEPKPYLQTRLPVLRIGKRRVKGYVRPRRVRIKGVSLRFEPFIVLMEVVGPLGSPV
jgi:hypothetical protein